MNIVALSVAEARKFSRYLDDMRVNYTMYASGDWKAGKDLVFLRHRRAEIAQLSSKNEAVTAHVDDEPVPLRIVPTNGVVVFVCE